MMPAAKHAEAMLQIALHHALFQLVSRAAPWLCQWCVICSQALVKV
jgi:hypothetical protein